MELKAGKYCPLLKKDCIQLQCNWFIQVRGKDMNTGKDVDEWGCSIAWLPHLLIENANQTRQAGAATESFRNEMVKASENTVAAMITIADKRDKEERTMRLIDASDDN
jgi:hypothetical protein